MVNASQKLKRGWFHTEGRPGDRSFDQQLLGLDQMFTECKGKTLLDVGCAEGLISIEAARRGALAVHGVEIVSEHVKVGQRLVGGLPVTLENADANNWKPRRQYHIVIALALLHKLRAPDVACARFAEACAELMVLRLPPATAPTIIDARSGSRPYDINRTMLDTGFVLESAGYSGPFGEWVGYYRRVK